MEYNKIISVTGLIGLFELVSSKTDGAIVRSLDDNSVKFIASRLHNFSHLESIEVYTVTDNVNLVDIFKAMEDSTEALPDAKDSAAVKKYFEIVFPDMDFERVYSSDTKKMVRWYQVLKGKVDFTLGEEKPAEEEAVVEEAPVAAQKEGKDEKKKVTKAPKETPQ
ncbi:MAG: DUF5606 domain-containing protein [Chitinophagaceae bacterium]